MLQPKGTEALEKGPMNEWDLSWVSELHVIWDRDKLFRSCSQKGAPFTRGLKQSEGEPVVVGCIECVHNNFEALKPITRLIAEHGCLKNPSVDMLLSETLQFHDNCGFPDPSRLESVALKDAWAIKKMLTFCRHKWTRPETPRVP